MADPKPEPLPLSDRALEKENADLRAENDRLRGAVKAREEEDLADEPEDDEPAPDEDDVGVLLGE